LGDRISMCPADSVNTPDCTAGWFVEDVNLFATTLRFAATNEVSSVNNGSIANCRIVNHARSPGAIVTLDLMFAVKATHKDMDMFKKAVTKYVRNNPRAWSSIIHFRTTQIDSDMEFVKYSLRLQHTKSWQELSQVLNARGVLMKFCTKTMEKLGTVYESPGRPLRVNLHRDETSGDNETDGKIGQQSSFETRSASAGE